MNSKSYAKYNIERVMDWDDAVMTKEYKFEQLEHYFYLYFKAKRLIISLQKEK